MKSLPLLAALAMVAAAAGCTSPDESAAEERTRGLVANMPEGATKLIVDVTADAPGGSQLSIVVDANGTVLKEDAFEAAGETDERVVEVDTAGAQLVGVTITARGDVLVHLVLHAVHADGSQSILRDEWMTIADA